MFFAKHKTRMVEAEEALPGRDDAMPVPARHLVLGTPLEPPFPAEMETAVFALGCFWGAERKFWQADGVYTTAVGYAGGFTPNPTYEEVCSGRTGHAEAVLVVFDPTRIGYEDLLRIFWESHDPTQGMRQGNDVGTQYRSAIYVSSDLQQKAAEASRDMYQDRLTAAGHGQITTEIRPLRSGHAGRPLRSGHAGRPLRSGHAGRPLRSGHAGSATGTFFFAEDYHQQYLARNPSGYCGLGGTGVSCPIGLAGAQ